MSISHYRHETRLYVLVQMGKAHFLKRETITIFAIFLRTVSSSWVFMHVMETSTETTMLCTADWIGSLLFHKKRKGRAALLQCGNQITRNTAGGKNFCKPPRTQVTNTTPTATVSSSMNALAFNPSRSHCSNPEQLRDLVPRVNSNAHLFYRIFVSHSADASSVTFIIFFNFPTSH